MRKGKAGILKREIITKVCKRVKCKRKEADDIINAYTDVIIEELTGRRSFRIERLGTLQHVRSQPRNGFNPLKQKKEVFISRNKIKFTPSKAMAELLNLPENDGEDKED